MFEALTILTDTATISVVHKTLNQLFARKGADTTKVPIETEKLVEITKQWDDLTDEKQREIIGQLSNGLIYEIESKEKVPASSFSEDLVKKYTLELGQFVRDRTMKKNNIDPARTQELIEQLRRDYP